MDWNWILMGLSMLLNIISLMILVQCRKMNGFDAVEDVQAIQHSMEAFVTKMEEENDELYQKMVDHMKAKQHAADERIRLLEDKVHLLHEELAAEGAGDTMSPSVDQEAAAGLSGNQQLEEEKILQLYKQGFSPRQIAKVLQLDYGKVDLIINMFHKRQISK
jgi:DNA-binding NarL/FixJ family response regulator